MSVKTGGPSVPAKIQREPSNLYGLDQRGSSITKVQAREGSAIIKLSEPLDESNWMAWHKRMTRVLRLCGVEEYAKGK
jgi:hypothetical protein